MSNDLERMSAWWSALSARQRSEALAVTDLLPEWMTVSLANRGVDLAPSGEVPKGPDRFVVSRSLRSFLNDQRANA